MTEVESIRRDAPARVATFQALRVRDFRLYFIGQLCSVTGNNAQTVAAGWLILELTNNPSVLGLVTALQYAPLLVLGPIFGSIPDRFPKRRVLICTQGLALVIATTLWLITAAGAATPGNIAGLALALGVVSALDNPTRQAFIRDLAGADLLPNALALNNVLMGAARISGPAIAAVIIATAGIAYCFLFNALTFAVIAVALLMIRSGRKKVRGTIANTSIAAGFRYVASAPEVRRGLLLMTVVGTFTYEFWVTLPVLVKDVFDKGSFAYGLMISAMSAGSVTGGIVVAHKSQRMQSMEVATTVAFGLATVLVGISPTFSLAFVAAFAMGATYSAFVAVNNATIQRHLESQFRGRVMGLWTAAFMGSTAIGGPLMGRIAQQYGARTSLILGGIAAVAGAFWIGRKQWLSTAN